MVYNPLASVLDVLVEQLADTKNYVELFERAEKMPLRPDAKLKVIGAGFSRTGTLSTFSAFMRLGMKTYHGIELRHPHIAARWMEVLNQDLKYGNVQGVNWRKTLEGFDAGMDLPFCVGQWDTLRKYMFSGADVQLLNGVQSANAILQDYWRDIAQAFPDAKVVYTSRDGEQWLNSMRTAIEQPYALNRWHYMATFWFPSLRKQLNVVKSTWEKYDRDYGGLHARLMDERLEEIKKHIAPERLLIWHAKEGWEPLCDFLELPIPDQPFPNVNDGPSMTLIFNSITIVGMSIWAAVIAIIVGAVYWLLQRV